MTEGLPTRPERRRYQRCVVGIPVQAVRPDAPQDDPRRVIGLHILDLSRGGAGAASQEALEQDQALILLFPPVGSGKGRDTPGQVVRCDGRGSHYAVGIAFEEPWPEYEEIRVG